MFRHLEEIGVLIEAEQVEKNVPEHETKDVEQKSGAEFTASEKETENEAE